MVVLTVEYRHIQAASAALAQVAFSGRDLAAWRTGQGIEDDDLERAAAESAQDTLDEIEDLVEKGISFDADQLREFIMREYMTAFQVGWICRSRAEQRDPEPAST